MTPTSYAALALLAGASFFSQAASAACYMVYGPDQTVVYQSMEPPVNMARQIHETLPTVVPGGALVFSPSNEGCELIINKLPLVAAQRPPEGAANPFAAPQRSRRGARG